MSVHYKFKSALDFDTVTFDGLNISVGDLKRAIIHQKRLGKVTDFDLQITNAQTKEEYQDDATLIPKNTSLIVARIPISQPKKAWNPQNIEKTQQTRTASRGDGNSLDLSKMKGSEEDKILEMMIQSTADYDPKSYHRIRGHSQVGEVPPTYRCNRCKKTGHWIKNCPYTLGKEHSDVKRNTGIPRSFLDKDDNETPADFPEPAVTTESKKEIPEDLICSICKDLFVDAVMIPCCGSSFCDDCVRSALLESEENECPDCKEKGCSPGSLIPNRFLRNSVNAFKNENGYTNLRSKKAIEEKPNDNGENLSTKVKVDTTTTEVIKLEEKQPEVTTTPKEILQSGEDTKGKEVVENNAKVEATKADEVESDFEDNITIKMPPVPAKNSSAGTAEPTSGRSVSHPKPPGIESSPHHKLQISPSDTHKRDSHFGSDSQSNEWDHDYKPERDYPEEDANGNVFYKNSTLKQHSHPISSQLHYGPNKIQVRPPRPNHLMDVYSGPPNRVNTYQQMPVPHTIAQDPGVQGQPMMPFGVYNPMGPRPNVGYQHSVRPMFHNVPPGFPPIRCPPADMHHTNSNLASVYQGVAAKVGTGIIEDPLETFNRLMKEKERRREERRRSMERRRSWSNERPNRGRLHASPYRRPPREVKEKLRPHDTDRKRDNGFDRNKPTRRRRSNSFSDKSSRSRSWSNSPIKKRSRSPYIKRSRSRTHTFQEKQRDGGKSHNIREDDLHQESAMLRRSASEERARSLRQSNSEWYPHQGSSLGSFDSEKYLISRKDRFQEAQLESLEPPPPGYEPNPSSYNSNYNPLQQEYVNPRKRTERTASDTKEKRQFETRRSSDKNVAKTVNKATDKKVRRTRSPTPVSKKRSGSSEKLEKNANKRSRNNFPTPRKSAERSKADDYLKRAEASSTEAAKRSNEKRLRTPDDTPVKEVGAGRAKNEKPETSPEKHRNRHAIVAKDDEVHSNSSKDEKASKKVKDKERKKKRKDKNERKKVKKEKRSKRDRERQRNSTEAEDRKQLDEYDENKDIYISRTPELNICKNISPPGDMTSNEENKGNTSTSLTLDDEVAIKNIGKENTQDKAKTDSNTNETEFRRVDSVLDILDYETEFDDLNSQSQHKQKTIAPVPEPSKWEMDEQISSVASQIVSLEPKESTDFQNEKLPNEKVTNEVLRKAENAIFARAIKAIYPFEKTDVNVDHQRVYSEALPRIATKDKIKNFEITVPTSNSQERSVQIKDDSTSHSSKIVKSVKERLGSKITTKFDYSPGKDSASKQQHLKGSSMGRSAYERVEERNRNKFKDRDRDNRDRRESRDNRDRNVTQKLTTLSSRDRDRERNRDRDRDRDRDRYHENDKYRNNDRDRTRDRERNHLKDGRNRSPKQFGREIDIASRSRPRIRDRDDDQSSHTILAHKRRENTPDISREKHKAKKRTLEERACSSNTDQINKKRSISKERNKNETHDSKKSFTESENRLKLNNSSACSSSGSADTSSDSESDEGKRRKKHKYKKDKKRTKRSLSAESAVSSKEKHAKNKKRNKSAKKKKKNKK